MSRVPRLHITQDEHRFWMLTLEETDGKLSLLAHQFSRPTHLIEDAIEMVFGSKADPSRFPNAQIIIDPPRGSVSERSESWPTDYEPPRPKTTL